MKKRLIFSTFFSLSFLSYSMEENTPSSMQLAKAREDIFHGINGYDYPLFKKGWDTQRQQTTQDIDLIRQAINQKFSAVQMYTPKAYQTVQLRNLTSNLGILGCYFTLTYLSDQLTAECDYSLCQRLSQVSGWTQTICYLGTVFTVLKANIKISNAHTTVEQRKKITERIKQDMNTFEREFGNQESTTDKK